MNIIVNTIVKTLWSLVSDVLCHELINCMWDYPIYLLKEGILFCFVLIYIISFCFVVIHQIKMLQIVFSVFLERSQWKGVHGLNSMMFGLAVQKFLNTEWFFIENKIKLNRSWKFQKSWNVPLVLFERSWWARFIW